jgi:ADP-ribose pyrophosphatase
MYWVRTELRKVGDGGGVAGEQIRCERVPRARAMEWLRERTREGMLIDPKVYAGLAFL